MMNMIPYCRSLTVLPRSHSLVTMSSKQISCRIWRFRTFQSVDLPVGVSHCHSHPRMPFMTSTARFSTQPKEQQQDEYNYPSLDNSPLYHEFTQVSKVIQQYDDSYYNLEGQSTEAPIIPDDEFDALVRREEELERQYPDFLKRWQEESGKGVTATRSGRVGAQVVTVVANTTATAPRLKRQHLTPMLSLDNALNDDQLYAWLRRVIKAATELHRMEKDVSTQDPSKPERLQVTIITEPKLDGVSLSLRYQREEKDTQWKLQWASTRGDGKVGQDVTAAVKMMPSIPLEFQNIVEDFKNIQEMEVRGEVVLPSSEFSRLQAAFKTEEERIQQLIQAGETDHDANVTNSNTAIREARAALVYFSNARNAASGILLRKESESEEEQRQADELRSLLQFFAYDIAVKSNSDLSMDCTTTRDALTGLGFSVASPVANTHLQWTTTDDQDESDTVSISEEWLQQQVIETGQIGTMMNYYSELMQYRIGLEPNFGESVNDMTGTSKSNKSPGGIKTRSRSVAYKWGDYDMDGCVHKVSDFTLRTYMGSTRKSPKHSIAHKFPAQSAVTHLLDVVVQVGRTGALTPVACLEPVEVGGVTIQRATLHNFGHMKEILGRSDNDPPVNVIQSNAPVVVRRAGDVIPQVVRSLSLPSNGVDFSSSFISLDPPKICPACGSDVVVDEIKATNATSSSAGQVTRCGGPPLLCPPRAITSLAHAYSRDALDVSGLSEARIQQLMDAGLLRYPGDIFEMKDEQWQTVAELPGWGKKSCHNLRESVKLVASQGISLGRYIYSLGIRHIGKHTSELIASMYGNLEAFFKEVDDARHGANLDGLDGEGKNTSQPFPSLRNELGVGPVMLDSLSSFAKSPELVAAAKNLSNCVNVYNRAAEHNASANGSSSIGELESQSDLPWKGYRVVFTGSLEGITRSEAQKLAKRLGAKSTPGSVSKSTDLVIFGEKGGKKLEEAQSLGVPTMAADDFLAIVKTKDLI
jgi:NAD-dependent DNA ligase